MTYEKAQNKVANEYGFKDWKTLEYKLKYYDLPNKLKQRYKDVAELFADSLAKDAFEAARFDKSNIKEAFLFTDYNDYKTRKKPSEI